MPGQPGRKGVPCGRYLGIWALRCGAVPGLCRAVGRRGLRPLRGTFYTALPRVAGADQRTFYTVRTHVQRRVPSAFHTVLTCPERTGRPRNSAPKHGSGNEGTTCMHQKIEKTGNSEMSTAVRTTVTPDRRRQRQIRRKIGPRLAVFEPAGTPITASAMWSGHENDPPRFRGSSSDPEGQIVAGAGFEPATSGL